jgi:hypothetical protein
VSRLAYRGFVVALRCALLDFVVFEGNLGLAAALFLTLKRVFVAPAVTLVE